MSAAPTTIRDWLPGFASAADRALADDPDPPVYTDDPDDDRDDDDHGIRFDDPDFRCWQHSEKVQRDFLRIELRGQEQPDGTVRLTCYKCKSPITATWEGSGFASRCEKCRPSDHDVWRRIAGLMPWPDNENIYGDDVPDHDAPEAEATPMLTIVSCAQAPDPPDPLFTNGPRPGELSLLLSESGKGKSFVLLALSVSYVTGRAFISSLRPHGAGRVLYLSYEDGACYLRNRLDGIDPHGGWREAEERGDLLIVEAPAPIFETVNRSVALTRTGGEALENTIQHYRPDLVILDPLSGVAVLDDENGNAALHAVADGLARMAKRHNCAIILAHHASKGRADMATQSMARGGSSLACRARLIWTLTDPEKVEANGFVLLSTVKSTHGPMPAPILLQRGVRGNFTEADYNDAQEVHTDRLARLMAEQLGKNEANWSARDINREAPAKHFREALKTKFGASMSRDLLSAAYNHAVAHGYIVEEKTRTGGTEKCVPRQSKNAKLAGQS